MLKKLNNIKIILGYGVLWGLIETTLGNYLHIIHSPLKGYILASIGCTIVASYITKHSNVSMGVLIGLIAASFKILNVIIYNVPFFHRSIINPALSIVIEAIAISVFVTYTKHIYNLRLISNK